MPSRSCLRPDQFIFISFPDGSISIPPYPQNLDPLNPPQHLSPTYSRALHSSNPLLLPVDSHLNHSIKTQMPLCQQPSAQSHPSQVCWPQTSVLAAQLHLCYLSEHNSCLLMPSSDSLRQECWGQKKTSPLCSRHRARAMPHSDLKPQVKHSFTAGTKTTLSLNSAPFPLNSSLFSSHLFQFTKLKNPFAISVTTLCKVWLSLLFTVLTSSLHFLTSKTERFVIYLLSVLFFSPILSKLSVYS